jgi:hypothetical protein
MKFLGRMADQYSLGRVIEQSCEPDAHHRPQALARFYSHFRPKCLADWRFTPFFALTRTIAAAIFHT